MSVKHIILISMASILPMSVGVAKAEQLHASASIYSDITSDNSENKISDDDLHEINRWGLSKAQWFKYKEIMNNTEAGFFYKDIDPITILGTYSETKQERSYYASLYIDSEIKRLQRVRAFDNAVNMEIDKRQPSLRLFQSTDERLKSKLPDNLQSSNTLKLVKTKLFVDANDCDSNCNEFVTDLISSSGTFSLLDIYFLNTGGNDNVIRNLASKWGITREKIVNYYVTINHDAGQYNQAKISGYRHSLPFALRESSYGTTTIQSTTNNH